eukprot:RCo018022
MAFFFNNASSLYLWYSSPSLGWTIARTLGSASLLAFNAMNVSTPDLLLSTSWMVWNGSTTVEDPLVQTLCTERDRAALLRFQQKVQGCDLSSWTTAGTTHCKGSWVGLSCDLQRVVSLNLSGMGCYGPLDLSILQPLPLKGLDLSGNAFHNAFGNSYFDLSMLPVTLTSFSVNSNELLAGALNLTALPPSVEHLDLGGCKFFGSVDLSVLPPSLSSVNLASNLFTGVVSVGSVPAGIRSLDLSHNNFEGYVLVSHLSASLQYLDLSYNLFSWDLAPHGTATVEYLDLSGNRPAGSLNFSFGHFPATVQCLRLSSCGLSQLLDVPAMPPSLTELDLSVNSFRSPPTLALNQLPVGLRWLSVSKNILSASIDFTALSPNLVTLDLSHNLFSGVANLTALPRSLTALHLDYNSFSQTNLELRSLPSSLTTLTGAHNLWDGALDLSAAPALYTVDLSYCRFTRLILSTAILQSGMGMTINLVGNPFSCPLPPVSIAVKVSSCQGSDTLAEMGEALRTFFAGVTGCEPVANSWQLGYPCVTSWMGITCSSSTSAPVPVTLSISATTCGATSSYTYSLGTLNFSTLGILPLTRLVFESVYVGGTASFADLPTSLEEITLEGGWLTGSIDLSHAPQALTQLSLAGNNLTGTPNLTALPSRVRSLDLSSNRFSGTISLRSLPMSLQTLRLASNQLTSVDADNATTLPTNFSVDLSDNPWSCPLTLPAAISNPCNAQCQGHFQTNSTCSVDCGTGTVVLTYVIPDAATAYACPYSAGTTKITSCNTQSCSSSVGVATLAAIIVAVAVATAAVILGVLLVRRCLRSRIIPPALEPVDMAFGTGTFRDENWERKYRALFQEHRFIVMEPDALLVAARGLVSGGSVNSEKFARQCLKWARKRYTRHSDILAVATCRFWTAGEEDSARKAPYRVINNALRPTLRQAGDADIVLSAVMPAVCLLTWALHSLPKTPEFARSPTAVYRVVPWLFPSPQCYDPESHFPRGTVITTYDFRAASRSLNIAANKDFSAPRWICEELPAKVDEHKVQGSERHYFFLEDLFPGFLVDMDEIVRTASVDCSRREGQIEGTSYAFEVVFGVKNEVDEEDMSMSLHPEVREVILKKEGSLAAIRAFHSASFATHFIIENAVVPYVAPLSYYPSEDEVLFSPLSQFRVRGVERNFPRTADKVTLVYVDTETPNGAVSARGPPALLLDTRDRRSEPSSPGLLCSTLALTAE